MAEPDRQARWLLGSSIVAVAVHLVGLYWPGSPEPGPSLPGADKVAHLLLFGVPVWLLGRLTGRIWLVAGIFAAHGVVSELIQHQLLPYRSGDPLDLLADLLGIAGAVVVLLAGRGRSRSAGDGA